MLRIKHIRLAPPLNSTYNFLGFQHGVSERRVHTSELGVFIVVASPATLSAGLLPIAAFWALMYTVTAIIEASGDNN